jgi:hypothetical protein
MNTQDEFLCPVCGLLLDFKPWDGESPSDEICPSCGIQFGYDDAAGGNMEMRNRCHARWREKWISSGMVWHSKGTRRPDNWDPKSQLTNLKLGG